MKSQIYKSKSIEVMIDQLVEIDFSQILYDVRVDNEVGQKIICRAQIAKNSTSNSWEFF